MDHKEEYYFRKNQQLTKALLKIKKIIISENIPNPKSRVLTIIDELDLESNWGKGGPHMVSPMVRFNDKDKPSSEVMVFKEIK